MKLIIIGSYAKSLLNFRGPLLETLVESGHQVTACAPEKDQTLAAQLQAIGVQYYPIRLGRGGINPLQDMTTVAGLYRLFRREQPDLVLGYTVKPVVYGSLAAHLAGVPASYSMITGLGYAFTEADRQERHRGKRYWLGKLVQSLYRISLSTNQAVFFQNPDDREEFIRLGLVDGAKTVLINGSGIDLSHYAPTPLLSSASIVFLLIARLLRDKGIAEYAQAAAIIKQNYPNTLFRLVGPFDPANPAAIKPQELENWNALEYCGATDDVRPHLAGSHVYVLPSYYREGTPRTVLEAMSMGRPVITTDAPGCRDRKSVV